MQFSQDSLWNGFKTTFRQTFKDLVFLYDPTLLHQSRSWVESTGGLDAAAELSLWRLMSPSQSWDAQQNYSAWQKAIGSESSSWKKFAYLSAFYTVTIVNAVPKAIILVSWTLLNLLACALFFSAFSSLWLWERFAPQPLQNFVASLGPSKPAPRFSPGPFSRQHLDDRCDSSLGNGTLSPSQASSISPVWNLPPPPSIDDAHVGFGDSNSYLLAQPPIAAPDPAPLSGAAFLKADPGTGTLDLSFLAPSTSFRRFLCQPDTAICAKKLSEWGIEVFEKRSHTSSSFAASLHHLVQASQGLLDSSLFEKDEDEDEDEDEDDSECIPVHFSDIRIMAMKEIFSLNSSIKDLSHPDHSADLQHLKFCIESLKTLYQPHFFFTDNPEEDASEAFDYQVLIAMEYAINTPAESSAAPSVDSSFDSINLRGPLFKYMKDSNTSQIHDHFVNPLASKEDFGSSFWQLLTLFIQAPTAEDDLSRLSTDRDSFLTGLAKMFEQQQHASSQSLLGRDRGAIMRTWILRSITMPYDSNQRNESNYQHNPWDSRCGTMTCESTIWCSERSYRDFRAFSDQVVLNWNGLYDAIEKCHLNGRPLSLPVDRQTSLAALFERMQRTLVLGDLLKKYQYTKYVFHDWKTLEQRAKTLLLLPSLQLVPKRK